MESGTRLSCFLPVIATCEQEARNKRERQRTIILDLTIEFIIFILFTLLLI